MRERCSFAASWSYKYRAFDLTLLIAILRFSDTPLDVHIWSHGVLNAVGLFFEILRQFLPSRRFTAAPPLSSP
jgi:hypothetical protein